LRVYEVDDLFPVPSLFACSCVRQLLLLLLYD
jgi:hypothetical protein